MYTLLVNYCSIETTWHECGCVCIIVIYAKIMIIITHNDE